ncbi:50S ribosomal protein L1 [Nanoarchaeota archaeon]
MDKKVLLEAVKKAKAESSKRNFNQTVEMIISLKDMDMNKPEQQLDFFITTSKSLGIKRSVCALVGPELKDEAKKVCDHVVNQSDFGKLKGPDVKKLAKKHDFFIAQANIMPQVATVFGRFLGPRGKMPNPKAGSIVGPKAPLKPVYEKLQNTIRVSAKKSPVVQVIVGKEDMSDAELAQTAWFIYDQVIHKLPKEHNNVRDVYLKLTMGKSVKA